MNWSDIASVAVEHSPHPLAVIDSEGRIRVANYAFGKLLGRTRRELVDTPLATLLKRVGEPPDEGCFAALVATARKPVQCLVKGPAGHDFVFAAELEPYGEGTFQGGLVSIRGVITRHGRPECDADFEIDLSDQLFGTLLHLRVMGRDFGREALSTERCHKLFFDRDARCDDCPAADLSGACGTVTQSVRHAGHGSDAYHTITARATDRSTAVVSRRRLEGDVLSQALTARLTHRALQAGLSMREREVLDYLVRGATLEGIAVALTIERRTVKFHQTNLLAKLGVTSRTDLLRLLM